MAKRALKKAAKAKGRANGAVRAVPKAQLSMDLPDDSRTYYINHAEVGHTKHEFSITFGKIPSKLTTLSRQLAQETGQVKIEATLALLVPPTLIPDLIEILTVHKAKYEAQHGAIGGGQDAAKEDGR